MSINKVNISEKLEQIHDIWNPRIVGDLNGQRVKLTKANSEYVFHKHDNDDEVFWVQKVILRWSL